MISCQECGHECTEKDFEIRINLCDHLYLDTLAKKLEIKERGGEKVLRQWGWRDLMLCP